MTGRGSFGRLSDAQRELLRPFVAGRVVHDLGAGSGALSLILLELGATHVVAIDKELGLQTHDLVTSVECYFDEYSSDDPIDTVLVSWIPNYPTPGLSFLASLAKQVIYLGKNTDGSSCGTRELMVGLLSRHVLAHAPERQNTLTVYGESQGRYVDRQVTGEEYAALYETRMISFAEAEIESKRFDHLKPVRGFL